MGCRLQHRLCVTKTLTLTHFNSKTNPLSYFSQPLDCTSLVPDSTRWCCVLHCGGGNGEHLCVYYWSRSKWVHSVRNWLHKERVQEESVYSTAPHGGLQSPRACSPTAAGLTSRRNSWNGGDQQLHERGACVSFEISLWQKSQCCQKK